MAEDEPSGRTERPEGQLPRLAARVERLEAEAARQREETAKLRALVEGRSAGRPSDEESVVVRRETEDDVGRLVQFVFDAVAEDRDLERDPAKVERRASRRWNVTADVVAAELERRGTSPAELDAEMGWPAGQTESLFAEPAKFSYEKLRHLSKRLGIPMTKMFELRDPEGEGG